MKQLYRFYLKIKEHNKTEISSQEIKELKKSVVAFFV